MLGGFYTRCGYAASGNQQKSRYVGGDHQDWKAVYYTDLPLVLSEFRMLSSLRAPGLQRVQSRHRMHRESFGDLSG